MFVDQMWCDGIAGLGHSRQLDRRVVLGGDGETAIERRGHSSHHYQYLSQLHHQECEQHCSVLEEDLEFLHKLVDMTFTSIDLVCCVGMIVLFYRARYSIISSISVLPNTINILKDISS